MSAQTTEALLKTNDPEVLLTLARYGLYPRQGFTYEEYQQRVPLETRNQIALKIAAQAASELVGGLEAAFANLPKSDSNQQQQS
ncbi:MAG: hypothetical protein PVI21_04895 [Candidatus Woesebacteria bacterium]|jgi:hypothetical protein